MSENPLVTINILSFNRKDELRNTLAKVYEQGYKNIEVIVVDNASNDGSPEMVTREFPDVQQRSTISLLSSPNVPPIGEKSGHHIVHLEWQLVPVWSP